MTSVRAEVTATAITGDELAGTLDRPSFERAVLRLAEGDRSAAPAVFEVLWPRLLRFCERAVGSDGEDCAQRAMLKLFEEVSRFDPSRSALAWAYAIAAWECRTVVRARSRSRVDSGDVDAVAGPELDLEERDLVQRALNLIGTDADWRTLEDDLAGETSDAHRQRRHRLFTRLRHAWRTLYGT